MSKAGGHTSLLARLARTAAKLVAFCACVVVLAVALTNAAIVLGCDDDIGDADAAAAFQADAIVVPGASVQADGTPSDILQARLDAAIELYFDGVADVIVVSGYDDGEYYNEAEVMRQYAIDQGVPKKDIVCDEEGDSTYDTMWRTRNELGFERVVVVTQDYHLYRAVFDAQGVGMRVLGVSCGSVAGYDDQLWFNAREVLARTKDFCMALAGMADAD